jgi:hypothetical protein
MEGALPLSYALNPLKGDIVQTDRRIWRQPENELLRRTLRIDFKILKIQLA